MSRHFNITFYRRIPFTNLLISTEKKQHLDYNQHLFLLAFVLEDRDFKSSGCSLWPFMFKNVCRIHFT